MNRSDRQPGFTLLEVMIALVIFAVVSVALIKNATLSMRQASEVERRSVGLWLAENEMTRLRLAPRTASSFPAVGVSRESRQMANRRWELETTVEATEDDLIRRVTIMVYQQGSTDSPAAELVGFIGRH